MPDRIKLLYSHWVMKNPNFNFYFYDDEKIYSFLRENFGTEVLEIVKSFPKGVMRADFWRYALMYVRGGIHMDLDTICLKPVEKWDSYPFVN